MELILFLYLICRSILSGTCPTGTCRAISAGYCRGNNNGKAAEAYKVPEGRDTVRNGTATLPHADTACDNTPYVGEMRTIYKEDRNRNTALDCCHMVP